MRDRRLVSPVRGPGWSIGRMLAGAIVFAAGGCLSLGGKTTYMQTSPETEARIAGLETRVGALEQAQFTRSVPAVEYGSGETVFGRPDAPRQ